MRFLKEKKKRKKEAEIETTFIIKERFKTYKNVN
jgi:hypothetical protein